MVEIKKNKTHTSIQNQMKSLDLVTWFISFNPHIIPIREIETEAQKKKKCPKKTGLIRGGGKIRTQAI